MKSFEKYFILTLIFIIIIFAISCKNESDNEDDDSSGAILINYFVNSQEPVSFPHTKHNTEENIACNICHHTYNEGEIITVLCHQCHTHDSTGAATSAKNAYHTKCINCHTNEGDGPTSCNSCHNSE